MSSGDVFFPFFSSWLCCNQFACCYRFWLLISMWWFGSFYLGIPLPVCELIPLYIGVIPLIYGDLRLSRYSIHCLIGYMLLSGGTNQSWSDFTCYALVADCSMVWFLLIWAYMYMLVIGETVLWTQFLWAIDLTLLRSIVIWYSIAGVPNVLYRGFCLSVYSYCRWSDVVIQELCVVCLLWIHRHWV